MGLKVCVSGYDRIDLFEMVETKTAPGFGQGCWEMSVTAKCD